VGGPAPGDAWRKAHDAYLETHLHRLRLLAERALDRRDAGGSRDESLGRAVAAHESRLRELDGELAALGARSGLRALQEIARLSDLEVEAVLVSLAPELDAGFGALYANLHGDPAQRAPTPALLAALGQRSLAETWELLHPDAPSVRFRLFEPAPERSPARPGALRLDHRVVDFLLGVNHLDERLEHAVEVLPELPLPDRLSALADDLAAWMADPDRTAGHTTVNLTGRPGHGREAVAAAVARALGFVPLRLDPALVAASPEADDLLRRLDRETLLLPAALYVDAPARDEDRAVSAAVDHALDRLPGLVFVGSEHRWEGRRDAVAVAVPPPTRLEERQVWKRVLAGHETAGCEGVVAELAEQFHLGPEGVVRALEEAVARAELETGSPVVERRHLWAACRGRLGAEVGELARRLEPAHGWDDLVLPDREHEMLRRIAAQVGRRPLVYEDWGFGRTLSRGRGITALFSGPPGTGKTMAAEIIAGHLDLDLYRIDLATVVSKYIGETEKNLRRVFDAAGGGGAILFFDEADALFGKRTEVKDSHDRYANIEINYLLQRMEEYAGLAILATNRKADLDPAFLRRIRFVVAFPFPDPAHRRRIWETVFPPQAPLDDLDWAALARLEIAGGNIRNIAVNAAFLAADAGGRIGMAHVLAATRQEFDKLDRRPGRAELGPYYEAVTG
jgi:hypothetical protein